MNKVFFFVMLGLQVCAHNIAFVYLGKNVPKCLFTVIDQARYMNDDCDMYLLVDREALESMTVINRETLSKNRIELIDLRDIPVTQVHAAWREYNKIDKGILEGFWSYAVERYFYLFDFMQNRRLEHVIHMEADVMVYVDLKELLPLLQKTKIAVPFQSTACSVPCFTFFQNSFVFEPLLQHIVDETKRYTGSKPHIELNDMALFASFYAKFGSRYMTTLPTLMPEYGALFQPRKSSFEPDNHTPLQFLAENVEMFPGYIFDAATLGVFINGNDGRYFSTKGPGIVHHRSLFDPRLFLFSWERDQKNRKVPYLTFEEKRYRIVNLHFHSKQPEKFTSYEACVNPKRSKYFIAVKKNEGDVLSTLDSYVPLLAPRDQFYADPMLFKKDGVNYIFFEEFDYKKGVISYVTLDEQGVASEPTRALEMGYHLSFPHVFLDNGNIYMTPESSEVKEVALFEAVEFPNKWEKKRVLVKGESFVDPIVFQHDGLYWLITAVHWDDLRIYYAKDLESEFIPHPINSQRLRERNAGNVYWENGKWIRPVMTDCRQGYGRAMILNEIVKLTPQEFIEKPFAYIHPTWAFGLDGTHTYNQNDDFVIYDGRRTIFLDEDRKYSR